ncbi:CmcJ/NvfI family oxidoreductase [Sphingosinicella sp. CPCC 101087]|uniref:CmcJ/NvfI family oxidoreductase n=1 Tax=Sphingosinicella sp. CPCC 101087 TaxID=2497754 RepID=UPI00101D0447|nr:CmcJ/NvfI family oxidoreductase [Sphingosinicella sp. CPCC 101087]
MANIARPPRTVEAEINYLGPMDSMPYFYAKDHARDNLMLEKHCVGIEDARQADPAPSLEREGFTLVPHRSEVGDFTDTPTVESIYPREIEVLIRELTGADHVVARGTVLRFVRNDRREAFVNSLPAGFVHVDVSRESFDDFAARSVADHPDRGALLAGRYVGLNIWRVLTPPPQDMPLAVCAAPSVTEAERVTGEARVDGVGIEEFRFGSSLFRASPRHRWYYYRDMTPGEALIFKQFDTADPEIVGCPHVAFADPGAPKDAVPRASVEIRAFAYWR